MYIIDSISGPKENEAQMIKSNDINHKRRKRGGAGGPGPPPNNLSWGGGGGEHTLFPTFSFNFYVKQEKITNVPN